MIFLSNYIAMPITSLTIRTKGCEWLVRMQYQLDRLIQGLSRKVNSLECLLCILPPHLNFLNHRRRTFRRPWCRLSQQQVELRQRQAMLGILSNVIANTADGSSILTICMLFVPKCLHKFWNLFWLKFNVMHCQQHLFNYPCIQMNT